MLQLFYWYELIFIVSRQNPNTFGSTREEFLWFAMQDWRGALIVVAVVIDSPSRQNRILNMHVNAKEDRSVMICCDGLCLRTEATNQRSGRASSFALPPIHRLVSLASRALLSHNRPPASTTLITRTKSHRVLIWCFVQSLYVKCCTATEKKQQYSFIVMLYIDFVQNVYQACAYIHWNQFYYQFNLDVAVSYFYCPKTLIIKWLYRCCS